MGATKRKKQAVADLPYGVAVGKHEKGWRVRLGRKFTGGKVIEKYFPTLIDAKSWIDKETPRQNQIQASGLSPAELSEAVAAYAQLRPLGVGLAIAVASFVKTYIPPDRRKTFSELAAEFMRDKRKKKKKLKGSTLKSYLGFYRRFSETFRKTPVSQMQAKDIDAWLDDHDFDGINYNNYLKHLRMLWDFALKKKYVTGNVVADIELAMVLSKPVTILTPEQADSLLEAAEKEEGRPLLAYIALALFAGLRTSELQQLTWACIHLDTARPVIEVTAEQAKTRRRRIVPIQDNLLGWLTLTRQAPTELVIPYNRETNLFWDKRDALRKAAGLNEWPRNVLRHSFGSYLLASTNDENLTAAQMGNSPSIVIKHYRETVRPEVAEKYWNLSSEKPANVIPLPTSTKLIEKNSPLKGTSKQSLNLIPRDHAFRARVTRNRVVRD
jgi:integrase